MLGWQRCYFAYQARVHSRTCVFLKHSPTFVEGYSVWSISTLSQLSTNDPATGGVSRVFKMSRTWIYLSDYSILLKHSLFSSILARNAKCIDDIVWLQLPWFQSEILIYWHCEWVYNLYTLYAPVSITWPILQSSVSSRLIIWTYE